jgi:hypothetical protein
MATNIPDQRDALHRAAPVGARLETLRGAPLQVGAAIVTPIARRLAVRWPGSGWVYAWPAAVAVQTARGTQRARIWPTQRILLAALTTASLAALVGGVMRWALNRRRERDATNETNTQREMQERSDLK